MLPLFVALLLAEIPCQTANVKAPTAPSATIKLVIEPFGYHGVRLDDGPLRQQRDAARADFLRIPNDDLLKGFRQRAGLPAPGSNLGGWYSSDTFHIFGQILSGLARLYAVNGDLSCREKAEALLKAWAETMEPDGYFFYSRKPNAPHYIYDKMVGGLTDLVLFCDSKLAADALAKITGWATQNLDRTNAYAFSETEWYTLSENLYRAHQATGDVRYLDFARVWHYSDYWGVFARKGDLFGDRGNGARTKVYHAYSHVNTLGGAAQAYLHTGDRRFLDALVHAHDNLVARQCFPTGGFGPDEQLLPRGDWRRKTDYSHNSFETQCGTFAVFKLCKYLITITGHARYGDWVERLTYNAMAAAPPMSSDGLVFYYSDYSALGGAKHNHSVGWSCCTGTRPMALADLGDLVYFHSTDDFYVNLFVPSTVTWDRANGRVTICQRTRFPEADSTELTVATKGPATFNLKLRAPGWLAGPLSIMVNGDSIPASADANGWVVVHRQWHDGDRALIYLPMKFDTQSLDSASPFPAFLIRGPVALAVRTTGKNPGAFLRAANLDDILIPSPGEPLTYHARSDQNLLVRPFYAFKQGEPYFLCLDPNRYSHSSAQFSGDNWRHSETFRYTNQAGASVTFDFDGTGVRWIGYRFNDAGIVDVHIDGKLIAKVDQYAPQRKIPFEWRKDSLPVGSHRLTLTVLDTKPAASKDRFINVAGFEVLP
jgi:uncharacterized protein